MLSETGDLETQRKRLSSPALRPFQDQFFYSQLISAEGAQIFCTV